MGVTVCVVAVSPNGNYEERRERESEKKAVESGVEVRLRRRRRGGGVVGGVTRINEQATKLRIIKSAAENRLHPCGSGV